MNGRTVQPHQPFVSIPQHVTKVFTSRLKLNYGYQKEIKLSFWEEFEILLGLVALHSKVFLEFYIGGFCVFGGRGERIDMPSYLLSVNTK